MYYHPENKGKAGRGRECSKRRGEEAKGAKKDWARYVRTTSNSCADLSFVLYSKSFRARQSNPVSGQGIVPRKLGISPGGTQKHGNRFHMVRRRKEVRERTRFISPNSWYFRILYCFSMAGGWWPGSGFGCPWSPVWSPV